MNFVNFTSALEGDEKCLIGLMKITFLTISVAVSSHTQNTTYEYELTGVGEEHTSRKTIEIGYQQDIKLIRLQRQPGRIFTCDFY
jgi:hypothetical protein